MTRSMSFLVVGLLLLHMEGARSLAQCSPSDDTRISCPLVTDRPVIGTLSAQAANRWTLTVTSSGLLQITATLGLGARFYIYGPTGLVTEVFTASEATPEHTLQISAADGDTFDVFLDNPTDSGAPYAVMATWATTSLPGPGRPDATACSVPNGWTASGRGRWCGGDDGSVLGQVTDGDSVLLSARAYSNVRISADVSTPNREASLVVRARDSENLYVAILIPDGVAFQQSTSTGTSGRAALYFLKRVAGGHETVGSVFLPPDLTGPGRPSRLEVDANGSRFQVFVDGTRQLDVQDASYATGNVGLRIFGTSDYPCNATFSNISIAAR